MDNQDVPIEKPKKKIWLNIVLVIAIFVCVLIWVLTTNDIKEILDVLKNANYKFVFLGFLVMILYWMTTAFSLHLIVKGKVKDAISSFDSYNIANCAYFFNGITPFSSGGQPFQLYYLRKKGVKGANATGILMMNFIIYQIALTLLSTILLMLFFSDLKSVDNFLILVLVGFSINTIILIGLILCAISKKVSNIVLWFVEMVCRIKPLQKHKEKALEKAKIFVYETQMSFSELFKMKWIMIFALFFQIVALTCYYSIPFFVFEALNANLLFNSLPLIIAMTSFINVFMVWIPTPGSSGGAEWGFKTLFVLPVLGITTSMSVAGMLLWRLLTYYLSIINGFISVLLLGVRKKKNKEEL